jgi:monoamine oxidase
VVALAAAGAGLAACERGERIVGLAPRAARTPPSNARVVIVGAGLAGLTCAYRLKRDGVAATIHEASSRVGGRCFTRRGHFAGEHTSIDSQGYLNGAVESGERAAREVAADLGVRASA